MMPDYKKGEITAFGTSFRWEEQIVDDGTAYASNIVFGAYQEDQITNKQVPTCEIRFEINERDRTNRLYSYGFLEFEFVGKTDGTDAYAGVLRSSRKDPRLPDVARVIAKGYAEYYRSGCVESGQVRSVLTSNAKNLFFHFRNLLNVKERPIIWKNAGRMLHIIPNYWQEEIPTPQWVMLAGDDTSLGRSVREYLNTVLDSRGLSAPAIRSFQEYAAQQAWNIQGETSSRRFENDLRVYLTEQDKRAGSWDQALVKRAQIIYNVVKPHLVGSSLLDIGCGDGRISGVVAASCAFDRIKLVDVADNVPDLLKQAFKLDFTRYENGGPLPIGGETFDTVLLLTVLHHAHDPRGLLNLAWQATKRRLIIIESVVGVETERSSLSYEEQVAFAAFVDWFYNRVLYEGIPVPYNFTTVEKWETLFGDYKDMRLVKKEHLGRDIEIGPEYHVVFVLEKDAVPPCRHN
jgi:2-polyprenyl-3-methyl-5-hydroxy-6-metoxy-1,4-benzoquinol methylase